MCVSFQSLNWWPKEGHYKLRAQHGKGQTRMRGHGKKGVKWVLFGPGQSYFQEIRKILIIANFTSSKFCLALPFPLFFLNSFFLSLYLGGGWVVFVAVASFSALTLTYFCFLIFDCFQCCFCLLLFFSVVFSICCCFYLACGWVVFGAVASSERCR